MYLRERFLKCLKVKNVLLVIAGVLCLIFGLVILADLVSYYIDDLTTVAKAKATPDAVKALALGAVLILIATISRKLMGDARFYSSYFEGSLEGRITYKELAKASGKPVLCVAIELILFRFIYMKKYSFTKDEGKSIIELYSKKTLCECKNCGAPVEKKDYFAGTCIYCGSSDVFAKVLSGDKFYSISNEVKKGHKRPEYYQHGSLGAKKGLFLILAVIGIGVAFICGCMIADGVSKYNDHDYLVKEMLDSSNELFSTQQVKDSLASMIVFGSIVGIILLVLAVRMIFKFFFANEAESCSEYFAKSEKPFILASDIPSVKGKGQKIRQVRGALRSGYLAHSTLEVHDDELKVALAKKIVKDTCPSCAAPIVGAVDEDYTCQTCGNRIMGVIEKK